MLLSYFDNLQCSACTAIEITERSDSLWKVCDKSLGGRSLLSPTHQSLVTLENKTDVERQQTLGHTRSINPNMINHVPQQSPFIYVVCTRSNKNFVFVSSPMSRFKKLSKVRCQQPPVQQPLVCWHGSVAFPILPIHIANLSRLSKCILPLISIPKPLKLSNWQISYPIWQMSIPDVCVTSER